MKNLNKDFLLLISFSTKQILISAILSMAILLGSLSSSAGQPTGILERAFFYNDIYHFVDHPYKSPTFNEVNSFSQPFQIKCSNLNRIILPFYINDNSSKAILTFNLYQINTKKELIYSVLINSDNFTDPAKMGTHRAKGIFYHVWIPLSVDSKNKNYIWELTNEGEDNGNYEIGLYLTSTSHNQLKNAIIDGTILDKEFAAFYAYCQYHFNWIEILKTTLVRLNREKYFLGIYSLLIGGLVIYLRKLKSNIIKFD
tara:strand:+ start:656 stop:1423 length:768 start_codon:yes stop_codon:yes gene_type:complete